jgi:plastocyanin
VRTPLVIGTVLVCTACGCGGDGYRNDGGMMGTPTAVSSPDMWVVTILGQQGMRSFDPNPAPIAPGALVVWHNRDTATHRIVMNDGSFDSGAIAPGNSSSVMRLGAAGGYHCIIHPTMMFGSINP